jgi:hypothetical protein
MFGMIDVTQGIGLVTIVPGGLFELILPVWLLVRGFGRPKEEDEASAAPILLAEPA